MSIPNLSDHMAAVLQHVGKPCSFGASSTFGLFVKKAIPNVLTTEGFGLPIYDKVLWIVPGTLGAVKTDDVITVDGASMRVHGIGEADDRGLIPIAVTEEV